MRRRQSRQAFTIETDGQPSSRECAGDDGHSRGRHTDTGSQQVQCGAGAFTKRSRSVAIRTKDILKSTRTTIIICIRIEYIPNLNHFHYYLHNERNNDWAQRRDRTTLSIYAAAGICRPKHFSRPTHRRRVIQLNLFSNTVLC